MTHSVIDYQTGLQHRFDEYMNTVQTIANEIAQNIIKPFMKERKWQFFSGNGGWCVCDSKGKDMTYANDGSDPEWQEILEYLNIEIPGDDANTLGTIMPNCNIE